MIVIAIVGGIVCAELVFRLTLCLIIKVFNLEQEEYNPKHRIKRITV